MSRNLPNDITLLSGTRYLTSESEVAIMDEIDPNIALILEQEDPVETEKMRLPLRYPRWI